MFYEKTVIEGFLATNHHGQCSIVAHSESYNEQFRFSPATQFCRDFVRKHKETHTKTHTKIHKNTQKQKEDGQNHTQENTQKQFRRNTWKKHEIIHDNTKKT